MPEYVSGAAFHAASILYEGGKFGEALAKFQSFAKDYPNSPFIPDAQLRTAFCQVQLKQYAEAAATLNGFADKNPRLADQAIYWLGKAQTGVALAADPAKPADRENGLKTAVATLNAAAEKSLQMINADPDAKVRRAEALLEKADVQQLLKQYREASQIYEALGNEKVLPARADELTERLAAALHLAGDYARSDEVANNFLKNNPDSPLKAAMLFRLAENAFFNAKSMDAKPEFAGRREEVIRAYDEAFKRYDKLLKEGGDFDRKNLALFGLASCLVKKGDFDKAEVEFAKIPEPDRNGDLALVSYLQAECVLRQLPEDAKGAAKVNQLIESLTKAAGLLDAFANGNPKSPEAPDALLKLGVCQMRNGASWPCRRSGTPCSTPARRRSRKSRPPTRRSLRRPRRRWSGPSASPCSATRTGP